MRGGRVDVLTHRRLVRSPRGRAECRAGGAPSARNESTQAPRRGRAEGIPTSARKAFGWTRDGQVIPEGAEAVRRAFDTFLGEPSLSIRRIREDLNKAGHLTARGSEFSVDAVRYLLANPLYAGYIKHYASGSSTRCRMGCSRPS